MFSRKDQLLKKTGPDGIGRYDYLRLLKKEFEETKSEDSKYQVLANLANFAYDPINYDYIKSLKIIDLFLEQLKSSNEILIHFSIAALCNLSSDPTIKDIIMQKDGVRLIFNVLYHENEESVANAITTLIFLNSENKEYLIKSDDIVNKIKEIQKKSNSQLSNLATIFLQDKLKQK